MIIEAIDSLSKKLNRPIHFIACNSTMDERSVEYINLCKNRAKELNIDSCVHWFTEYLPIEVAQEYLIATDYIIYPYKDTRESASGAVTIGLSLKKPILVSPNEIFSDLRDVTYTMNGYEPKDIVDAIYELEIDNQKKDELLKREEKWLKNRSFDIISARLQSIFVSLLREKI